MVCVVSDSGARKGVGRKKKGTKRETNKNRKYLHSLHTQLKRGILIAHNHGVRVQLQAGKRPHVVNPLFHTTLQGGGLASTENNNHDLAGLQNGLHTDCQSHLRHLFEVIVEEAAVGEDSLVGQSLDARARGQARTGLVEGDVAILAYAGQEEVDAACRLDLGLVRDALGLEVGGVAVEDVDIARVNVYVREEVLPHEGVVALWVVPRDPDVFVLMSDRKEQSDPVQLNGGGLEAESEKSKRHYMTLVVL